MGSIQGAGSQPEAERPTPASRGAVSLPPCCKQETSPWRKPPCFHADLAGLVLLFFLCGAAFFFMGENKAKCFFSTKNGVLRRAGARRQIQEQEANTFRQREQCTHHALELSSFGHNAARRAERFAMEEAEHSTTSSELGVIGDEAERGNDGDRRLASRQSSGSRVHRVADFAKWATQVTEAAAAEAHAALRSTDWRLERRRRRAGKPVVPTAAAADTH